MTAKTLVLTLTKVRFKTSTPLALVKTAQQLIAANEESLTRQLRQATAGTQVRIGECFYFAIRPNTIPGLAELGYHQVDIGVITPDRPLFNSIGCTQMMEV